MQCDALRYSYLDGGAVTIATCYMNLGIYIYDHARQAAPTLASFLAAALILGCAGADADEVWCTAPETLAEELRKRSLNWVLSPGGRCWVRTKLPAHFCRGRPGLDRWVGLGIVA